MSLRWHILRIYYFVTEVTFKSTNAVSEKFKFANLLDVFQIFSNNNIELRAAIIPKRTWDWKKFWLFYNFKNIIPLQQVLLKWYISSQNLSLISIVLFWTLRYFRCTNYPHIFWHPKGTLNPKGSLEQLL